MDLRDESHLLSSIAQQVNPFPMMSNAQKKVESTFLGFCYQKNFPDIPENKI